MSGVCAISERTECRVRRMTSDDAALAIAWAAVEGWNPGLNDAGCFFQADPSGFFVAELDGVPIGSISSVNYGDQFAFIGLYIMVAGYRDRAYGASLALAAKRHVGRRTVGVDGVLARQDDYQRLGYQFAYRNIRFEGDGGVLPRRDRTVAGRLIDLIEVPFEVVAAYDRHYFPASRERFLQAWLAQPNAFTLGVMRDGDLRGYGVIRRCRIGYKIGPLFADGRDEAEALFAALTAHAVGEPVYLDVPEPNRPGVTMAQYLGMKPVFETARMYNGQVPEVRTDGIFGVTSFELG